MEVYLYYSYLKFRYEKKKPLWVVIKCIPWWMWLLFGLSIMGLIVGVLTYDTARGTIWRKVVLLASLCCMGLFCVGAERVQIRDSKTRMENYWKYIGNMKTFLTENGIKNRDDTELIKQRIECRLANAKQELQSMKENDDKWMQTLALPVVFAIITAFLSQQGDINERIAEIAAVLIVFAVLSFGFAGIVAILRSVRNWEITNLMWFREDLQGVLDLEHFQIEYTE